LLAFSLVVVMLNQTNQMERPMTAIDITHFTRLLIWGLFQSKGSAKGPTSKVPIVNFINAAQGIGGIFCSGERTEFVSIGAFDVGRVMPQFYSTF
jgi:hypothetical protein